LSAVRVKFNGFLIGTFRFFRPAAASRIGRLFRDDARSGSSAAGLPAASRRCTCTASWMAVRASSAAGGGQPDREVVQRRREVGFVGGGVGVAAASGGLLNRLRGIPVILAATPAPGSG